MWQAWLCGLACHQPLLLALSRLWVPAGLASLLVSLGPEHQPCPCRWFTWHLRVFLSPGLECIRCKDTSPWMSKACLSRPGVPCTHLT